MGWIILIIVVLILVFLINIYNNLVSLRQKVKNDSDLKEIQKVNELLKKDYYTYDSQTEWLDSEGMYGTFWVLDPILEKIRKEGN